MTDSLPLVTAVVPTRDRPELVRIAIDAIVAQDYAGPIEVLVVHDQVAPDTSLDRDLPGRTVRAIPNVRRPGLAGARNTGIDAAGGALVAFCDDDDRWHPDKLRLQLDLLERTGLGFAVAGVVIDREGREIERRCDRTVLRHEDLVASRIFAAHPSTYLMTRDLLQRIGHVDEDLPGSYAEDRDWILRAARIAPVAVHGDPLAHVMWHRKSFFSDRWATIAEAIDRMLEKHPELATDRTGLAHLYGRKAFAYAALGRRGDAWTWIRRTWRLAPGDLRAWVAVLVVSRVISAGRAQSIANAAGRGI